MAKIILGRTPKNFTKEVSFPMLDGTTGTIKATYIYRTRKDFAGFVDSRVDIIKKEAESAALAAEAKLATTRAAVDAGDARPAVDFGMSETEAAARKVTYQVDYIMGAVEGWNLDVDFDRAAVEQLADEVPQAVTAIIQSYVLAMNEGRLGN